MQPATILKRASIISLLTVLFISACGGSFNPPDWKSQVERRFSPQTLIQPDATAEFTAEMERELISFTPSAAFEYIKGEILYTNDFFNHASIDHLPSTEEVLATRQDDCDGQAILLCSILRLKGYEAYTAIGPSHAWVEVGTAPLVKLDYRGGAWYVRFNEREVQWNLSSLLLMVGEQFIILTVFFFVLIYAYEKGFLTYIQEVLGYFRYVLLFFFGYLLIGVLVLASKSTLAVGWLVLFILGTLLVMKAVTVARKRFRSFRRGSESQPRVPPR